MLAADERPLAERLAAAHRLPDLVGGRWYYVLGNYSALRLARNKISDLKRLLGPRGINLAGQGMVASLHLKLEGSVAGAQGLQPAVRGQKMMRSSSVVEKALVAIVQAL